MRDYRGYQLLIDRVKKIDCDAANYLLHVLPVQTRKSNYRFNPNQDLAACFLWSWTPQGNTYWLKIDTALRGR